MSRQTISNWENERRVPDIYSLVVLSDFYGVSLDDLIKGDPKILMLLSGKSEKVGQHFLYGTTALNAVGMLFLMHLETLTSWQKVVLLVLHFSTSLFLMQYFYPYYREVFSKLIEEDGKLAAFGYRVFYYLPIVFVLLILCFNLIYL